MSTVNTGNLAEIVKGFSNHHRIAILFILNNSPGLSVEEIAEAAQGEYKTIAVHVARLHRSGLITKQYRGRRVEHYNTKTGFKVLTFLRKLA